MDNKKSYSEKLKDPRWQKKRLEILERDGWKCQKCGDEKSTLHVHHLTYSGNLWDVDNDSLAALCEHCHGLIEEYKLDFNHFNAIKFTNDAGNKLLIAFHKNSKLFLLSVFKTDTHTSVITEKRLPAFLEFINKFYSQ